MTPPSSPLPLPEFTFGLPNAPTVSLPPEKPGQSPTAPAFSPPDTAWEETAAPHFLPDGTPLKLTLSRKFVMSTFFPRMEGVPVSPYECALTLFLSAHPRTAWESPAEDPEEPGILKPLWMVPQAMMRAVDRWLDSAFPASSNPADLCLLAQRLWVTEHSPQVVSAVEEKKNPAPPPSPAPIPSSTLPPSSPEEIPSGISTSSTSCPSGMPTPSSTPI